MPTLTTIPHLERRLRKADRSVHGHAVVHGLLAGAQEALLKFGPHGVSEVLGYQLAGLLDVPVPRHQGFWSAEAIDTPRDPVGPGRIGILVEFHADFRAIALEGFVEIDRRAAAGFLALCLFDRHEWPECGLTGGRPIVVDLERILPGVIPDVIGAEGVDETYLTRCAEGYMAQSPHLVAEAIEEIQRLALLSPVRAQLRRLQRRITSTSSPLFRLDPHPREEELCNLAEAALRVRLEEGLRQLVDR